MEKKFWKEQIKNSSHSNIDIHFLECNNGNRDNHTKSTDNLNCIESYIPGVFQKTFEALEHFQGNY